MKRFKFGVLIGMCILLTLACSLGGGSDNGSNQGSTGGNNSANQPDSGAIQNGKNEGSAAPTEPGAPESGKDGGLWETDFGALLTSGDLAIEQTQANQDGETVGEILTVVITNTGSDYIEVSLPCGLVFVPDDSEEQTLMLVQPVEISLAAGESAEITPFVVCIQLTAAAPSQNSGYTIGYLENGDLLTFADCVCGQTIDNSLGSMDSVGVQFAAWSIETGGDVAGLMDSADPAMQSFLNELDSSGMADVLGEMLGSFGQEWLDRCGITIGQP